ncbi:hypothetical protein [Cellulomonas sp. URHB0016]
MARTYDDRTPQDSGTGPDESELDPEKATEGDASEDEDRADAG